jgi:hypothetical protein
MPRQILLTLHRLHPLPLPAVQPPIQTCFRGATDATCPKYSGALSPQPNRPPSRPSTVPSSRARMQGSDFVSVGSKGERKRAGVQKEIHAEYGMMAWEGRDPLVISWRECEIQGPTLNISELTS